MTTLIHNANGDLVRQSLNLAALTLHARALGAGAVVALRACPKADGAGLLTVIYKNGDSAEVRFASFAVLQQWCKDRARYSPRSVVWPVLNVLETIPGYTVRGDRARVLYDPINYWPKTVAGAGHFNPAAKHWRTFRDDGSVGGMAASAHYATLPEAIAALEKLGHKFPTGAAELPK